MTTELATPAETSPVREYGHHIAGDTVGTATLDRFEPARHRLVARFAEADREQVDYAARAASAAFHSRAWQRAVATTRAELLERLACLLEDNADRLAALDSQEVGKPLRFASGDMSLGIAHVRQAAALARTSRGEALTSIAAHYTAIATREPVGVAALIIPWNFPAQILLQKLPYALAAGCTVVIKPSEYTSSTAIEIARLADEAGFPRGAVNVVTGRGATTGTALVSHPLISYVSFTGSSGAGRAVQRAAGDAPTRVGLELGGNTANVVFADADIEEAAESIVFGAFANQGESCVAGRRLIVDTRIADVLVEQITALSLRLAVGDPAHERTDLGPLIHTDHRDRVHQLVTTGLHHGATPVLGARLPIDGNLTLGAYYEPTILTHVSPESPLFHQETFGPVLAVTTFSDPDEAAQLANATPYGLAHSLWTTDLNRAFDVAQRLEAGTVWINTTSDGSPALAFGGVKGSGYGREAGAEGLEEFTYYKTVQIRGERRPSPFSGR
ncbi:aldehyde dehydrogenase family protein [Streptomyces spiralis]|uniref:aldehyde dehydrogenase family protein n=1 Tax=Streptomyces spiralis TaxID=66376 RepID=UPI0036981B9A